MHLPRETFKTIVESTPLISIDLVIIDSNDNVLLGKRNNRPAQDYWFVPGGRVLKDERLESAFQRLTNKELGYKFSINQAEPLGTFEHLYTDSIFSSQISTHYVVLGYKIKLNQVIDILKDEQHSDFKWWPLEELLDSNEVHENTKAYFK